MTAILILLLIGVALIDGKLWKMMAEQKRHRWMTEALLEQLPNDQNVLSASD